MKAGGERARSVPGLPKGSRLRKWRCPCGVIVRVASDDLRATCNRCLGEFARDHSVYGPNRNMARYGPRNRKEGA